LGKPKENWEEIPDLPTDREQSFSNSFADPAMDEMLPDLALDLANGNDLGIVAETAAAVQELMLDAGAQEAAAPESIFPLSDASLALPAAEAEMEIEPGIDISAEANQSFELEANNETALLIGRAEMADRLFALVASEQSFPVLMERILISLQRSINAQAGSILELDHERQEFFFRASVGGGDPEKVKAFRIPAFKGIVGHVAESRQPLLLKNLESDQKELQAISMSTGFETRSCVAAPILLDNQLYGVVELFNKVNGEFFNEKDLQVLEEGARMAAKVIEVRFLLAELVRRKR
jgi:hypothetical protein